ncbi:MAG: glycosyltransferase family 2 protein [Candidatus Omnitrophica bacterium]|nr:glycosyltransferase family 2 protein [Candidatus Omnitrophota bacterium]
MTPSITVVIPAYDEASRLPNTLKEIRDFLRDSGMAYEVIVVDDGSKDATVEVAKSELAGTPHLVLINGKNRGKGCCVRKGMLAASGKYILFTDADLSTPIRELNRMIPYLEDGYDIVIGSRAVQDPVVKRDMVWYREIMGRTYNLFAQLILFPGITDSQCGFKCFKHDVARDLFSRQKLEGFSFDGEILYLARKQKYRIKELAVHWFQDPKSKVKLFKDSIRMFFELIKIRLLHA